MTQNEKIEMRKVVKILKRWKRIAWGKIKDDVLNMIIWVEQKRSTDYYTKNVQAMKKVIGGLYDAEEEDNDDEDLLVFGYLNRLVQHYEGLT